MVVKFAVVYFLGTLYHDFVWIHSSDVVGKIKEHLESILPLFEGEVTLDLRIKLLRNL